ncbi:unnamed protein product [Spirodela intermedia]|uniref:Glutathione S-transferase n=1 Tax=Spirodela intermedia TaxID=51605 RepID=A0A7I8I9U5_SPIIN|nr:unnamed protein product [Spirodela intermedia]CAA6654419.1 unnamed protein product [Spirodela intermedia]
MDGGELKLYGAWASPYVQRVRLALKLKALDYEYVEENLANKSAALLHLNPVHRKVPILLHGDRPIAESAVILEYIDETWPRRFPLMPADPRERAAVRFWCHFGSDKMFPSLTAVIHSADEVQRAAAVGEVRENLKLLEDEGLLPRRRFFGCEKLGFLDIVLGVDAHFLRGVTEVAEVDLGETSPPSPAGYEVRSSPVRPGSASPFRYDSRLPPRPPPKDFGTSLGRRRLL